MTSKIGAFTQTVAFSGSNVENKSEEKSEVGQNVAIPVLSQVQGASSGGGSLGGGRVTGFKRNAEEAIDGKDEHDTPQPKRAATADEGQNKPVARTAASSNNETQVVKGNREIEFKATKVDEGQFKAAWEILKGMAQKGEVVAKGDADQEDHYLDHQAFKGSDTYALYGKGSVSKSLRIRREDALGDSGTKTGNHSVCVKVARKGVIESDHERREFTVQIDDPAEMLEVFNQLGFTAEKIIKKTRSSFLYQNYEVVLDQVVGLKKTSSPSSASKYEQEFSSYILEVELVQGAEEVKDIPVCLKEMQEFIETTLQVNKYVQEQSGMEKYMN